MPANLTPEYKAAEAAFRSASDQRERLERLREMLKTIPKHKGTEHLQADIKTRIKQLGDELHAPKRTGARGPSYVIRPEGAAQIALLGPPNSGKSALHRAVTGSHSEVGPYPFTTTLPIPGMLPYEDVLLQLVDLPPITPEHPLPWIGNALQPADAALLVVNLVDPECVGQFEALSTVMASRRVHLLADWEAGALWHPEVEEIDPFGIYLPALLIATHADEMADSDAEVGVFLELAGAEYPALALDATSPDAAHLGHWLFDALHVVRVYTKARGKPPELARPFTVRRGATVQDVARLVHKDLAATLRNARIWGRGVYAGQTVGPEHRVADGDILEIRT